MAKHTHFDPKRKSELETLLEAISTGTIADVDDLQQRDIDLLRSYYGDTETLESLFDRLRDSDASER